MNKLKILSFIVTITIFIGMNYFSGCSNNSVSPPVNNTVTVNGKVIDVYGNGVANVTVSINNLTATSASDGSFSFSSIKTPYDLKIISGGSTGIVYRGLTTANPIAYSIGVTSTPNSASLTVNVPAGRVGAFQKALVIFTDTIKVQSSSNIIGPGIMTNFNVQWPGNPTLAGKVLVLVANINGSGNITGYAAYGEKTFTLNNGSPAIVTFNSSDFNVTPGSATVSGSVIIPSGYTPPNSLITMSYVSGSALNTGVLLDGSGSSFSFTVPTGLTTGFKLFVAGNSNGGLVGESTAKIMNVVSPSSGNTLTLDPAPSLSTPADAATGIDTNTIFTYSSTSGTGIYLLTITSATKSFYIFTSGTTANIPNLSAYGLSLGSAVPYTWRVQRLLGVTSTDNFVSSTFLYNTQFTGLTRSTSRTFTSAP